MSKLETPMTRWYWQQIGGILIEEFPAVKKGKDRSPRYIDGVIILGRETKIAKASEVSITGEDIVVVQTKRGRLGMYLMGQALFSIDLMKKFSPRSIKSIALCEKNDSELGPLLENYGDIEVVLYQGD